MKILSLLVIILSSLSVLPAPKEVRISDCVFDKGYAGNIRYVESKKIASEGYELVIRRKRIKIRYSTPAGRFYAEKTLEQLLRNGEMYTGIIRDEPHFGWRGFMLDEARHFMGKDKVMELLDMMAEYKLNRFHWHLTDNQGWRIEIKAYPELIAIGAIGCETDRQAPAAFYSQDDIREIINYASSRHIEIIPEIDMPGHASALVRSIKGIDGRNGTLNPGSERTYEVLTDILREIAGLFPGRYIHIGGDEVLNKRWPELPEVVTLMEREGLDTVQDVQRYFERRVAGIVSSLGKQVLAWDDLMESGVPRENVVLQWWRADKPQLFEDGIRQGYRFVVCPHLPFYLDYCQDINHKIGHIGRKRYNNTLQQLYDFPVEDNPLVLGVQVNLWTEHVHNSDRVDFMVYPRIFALAELAWSWSRNYTDFLSRLEEVYSWMDKKHFYYYDARNPSRHPEPGCPNIKQ